MRSARTLCALAVAGAATAAQAQGYTFLSKCADAFLGIELAIDYCGRAIKSGDLSDDQMAIAHYNRGGYWSRRKAWDRAIADFSEVVRLAPGKAPAYVARGAMKAARRDNDGAIADFSEAIRLDPSLAEAYLQRGQAHLRRTAPGPAIADFTEAMKREPVDLIVNAGVVTGHSTRPRPRERAPHEAVALFGRGYAHSLARNFDAAIADFDAAVKLNPRHAQAMLARGGVWLQKGDHDRAIEDFSRVAQIVPTAHEAPKLRGFARFYRGEHAAAAADFTEALKLSAADTESALWLYLARARSGKPDEAAAGLAAHDFGQNPWALLLAKLFLGRATPQEVLAAVPENGGTRAAQRCHANFFVGQWRLLKGERAEAGKFLARAKDRCAAGSYEYLGASADLGRLGI